MYQCTLRYRNWLLTKFSDINSEPIIIWILFTIFTINFIFLRLLISYMPLYFNIDVKIKPVCKNSKSKKIYIYQRLKCNSVPNFLFYISLAAIIKICESKPFDWFLIFTFFYNKTNFGFFLNMMYFN